MDVFRDKIVPSSNRSSSIGDQGQRSTEARYGFGICWIDMLVKHYVEIVCRKDGGSWDWAGNMYFERALVRTQAGSHDDEFIHVNYRGLMVNGTMK